MARSPLADWMVHLPLVLPGIRTSVRQDSSWCPVELVYGATLRLPGEFLDSPSGLDVSPTTEYVTDLRRALQSMRPAPSSHHRGVGCRSSVPASLAAASHVYVRVDAVKRPLTRPYEGPFQVVSRSDKTFVLSRAGRSVTVSIDRLKPATGFCAALPPVPDPIAAPPAAALPSPLAPLSPARTTLRSGRSSRPPRRFGHSP